MFNLFIFNHILENTTIAALLRFRETHNEDDYYIAARGLIDFSETRLTEGNIIGEYVIRTMLENEVLPDVSNLRNFLRHDIKTIYNELLSVDWDNLFIESGLIPMSDITTPKTEMNIPGYAASIKAMLECSSNEALGGAFLAHIESFETGFHIFL